MKIEKVEQTRWNGEDLKDSTFGSIFSDHMLIAHYNDGAWQEAEIKPYGALQMFPSLHTLHYGQAIFEGMKAFRSKEDDILLFRPEQNFQRFNKSATRMCMPEVPEEMFLDGLKKLVDIDKQWVPTSETSALYIRPFMFSSSNFIKAIPSDDYIFIIIMSPVQAYYTGEVNVKVERNYTRAVTGGTGAAKTAGNYAASFFPAKLAQQQGFQQLIWTDAKEHRYIEESGTMNIFFRIGDELLTPPLSDTILAGITRNSVIQLAKHKGLTIREEVIDLEQLCAAYDSGALKEVFGAGTAATIAHVSSIDYNGKVMRFENQEDSFSDLLKTELQNIQYKRSEDPFGWTVIVESE